MSFHWNEEGKIKYACLSSPLDRFEVNSKNGNELVYVHGRKDHEDGLQCKTKNRSG
eukprot:CAMPEP_0201893608 /NCGR_PEP_ID=MMETSP0902-20130614/39002_1 /ASSEMBLY_ACC=CAM_ASM_000551 /TAXON_ID=420261 /ORGANISM="Thalassiosira antarctica, Strain CCMP982" /LENGTH=55 /DNA_ID=CAMNT_0048425455 /DNA_START=342 /DNA_END=505 /DNA_ORIENTATION=-